jgi:hypothetical protein
VVAEVVAAGHPHAAIDHRQFARPGADREGLPADHEFPGLAGVFTVCLSLRIHHQSPGVGEAMIYDFAVTFQ